ncbi:MAG: hypothetical protein KGL39_60075 [Patescibacteria group bacterium]|nr:hypothetical protein [Patescibacteria group bacterium]
MATLKNSQSTSKNTFDAIQKTLATHNAKQITFDYDGGRIVAIAFSIEVNGILLPFRLPARIQNVEKIMYGKNGNTLTTAQKEQAYRTAWANIRDWIAAQMAMIDTGMVKPEEIFLPYLISPQTGQTFYETMAEQKFLLLPEGRK